MSVCRGCGAPITWARTERGGRMPLEPAPEGAARGLFALRDKGSPEGPLAVACGPAFREHEAVFTSHFATCPQAAEFRR